LLEFRRSWKAPRAPELEPWDVAYYAEKQRAALYDFDEEALRPYFPAGARGRRPVRIGEPALRHSRDRGSRACRCGTRRSLLQHPRRRRRFLGGFYADWYPRENKRGGAWMDALITGGPTAGEFQPAPGPDLRQPDPPVGGRPALLTHREVETIFHEFGHLLHHLLSRVEIRTLAGTNVAWDFVELPSQIMENWCWERGGAGSVRAPLGDRRAMPEELFQKDEARAHLPRRQRADAPTRLRLHRPAAAHALFAGARWRPGCLHPAPAAGVQPRAAAAEHAMIAAFTHLFASPVGYGAGVLFLQVGRSPGCRRVHAFPRRRHLQPRSGRRVPRADSGQGRQRGPGGVVPQLHGPRPRSEALLERSGLVKAGTGSRRGPGEWPLTPVWTRCA
jgi:oligopeptidase A